MLQLTNSAKSTLAFGITSGDTSLQIIEADAGLFPALVLPGDYFIVALANNPLAGGDLKVEYVKVTATIGNVFTIERACEGSKAQAFEAGDRVELRMTAGAYADMRGNVWGRPMKGDSVQVPTRVNAATFSLPGDFTAQLAKHRAVRAYQTTDASGFVVSSSFANGKTTVIVSNMVIDTGLALIEFGLDVDAAPRYGHAATADESRRLGGRPSSYYAIKSHTHAGVYEPVFSKKGGFNLDIATQAEAKAGIVGNKAMTPQRVAQAIAALSGGGVPVGSKTHYEGTTAPDGWLVRDGSEVSRTTYADLFALIGTRYGTGDGSTTFNLADDRGRFDRGLPNGGTIGTAEADATAVNGLSLNKYSYGGGPHSYQTTGNLTHSPGGGTTYSPGVGGAIANGSYAVDRYGVIVGDPETLPQNRHLLPIIKY